VVQNFDLSDESRFFRLIHTEAPPHGENPENLDFDGDGISNLKELSSGCDPFSALDANNNSVPDDWEFFHNVADISEDIDMDGLTALQEYQAGSNPTDYFNGTMPTMEKIEGVPNSLSIRKHRPIPAPY
jgi:hypothetical protein